MKSVNVLRLIIFGVAIFSQNLPAFSMETGSAAAGSSAAASEAQYVRRLIVLNAEQIRPINADGTEGAAKEAEDYVAGEKIIYKGSPRMMTASNGMSSLFSSDGTVLYLKEGQILVVCKNQYVDHRDFAIREGELGPKVIRAHFIMKATGSAHVVACRCGSCGYRFDIVADPTTVDSEACQCKQTAPIHAGSEGCTIM